MEIGWAPWDILNWPLSFSGGVTPFRSATQTGDGGCGIDLGPVGGTACDLAGGIAGGAADLAGDATALTTDAAGTAGSVLGSQRFWDCVGFTLDAIGLGASVVPKWIPVAGQYAFAVQVGTTTGSFVIDYASGDWAGVAYNAAAAATAISPIGSYFAATATWYAFNQCTGGI